MRIGWRESGDADLPLIDVDAGRLRAVFLPAVGGRLLSLMVDGTELFWVNPLLFDRHLRCVKARRDWPASDGTYASWANVGGSKTWVAPQGDGRDEWQGPPDSVIDSGEWHASFAEFARTATVTMISPADRRTGLQITRDFQFTDGELGFTERICFHNITDRTLRWAPWEVAQIATHGRGRVEVVVESDAPVLDLGTYRGRGRWVVEDGVAILPVEAGVAKYGFPSGAGRCSWRGEQGQFITLSTTVDRGAYYPDGGSRVEVWTQSPQSEPIESLDGLLPDAWLVELEVLAPSIPIPPGERVILDVGWELGPPRNHSSRVSEVAASLSG